MYIMTNMIAMSRALKINEKRFKRIRCLYINIRWLME